MAVDVDSTEPGGGRRFTYAVTEGNFPCHVIEQLKRRGNWS